MKLDVNDNEMLLARIMLNGGDEVARIAETPEWKDNQTLTAEMTVNGISIPAEAFESFLHHWGEHLEEQIRERYDADKMDQIIDTAARKLINDEATAVLDKLYDMTQVLESADEVLKPYWERPELSQKVDELMVYLVTGGRLVDPDKDATAYIEDTVESFGPYETHEEAHAVWASKMWANVDDAHHRLQVVPTPAKFFLDESN